MDFSKTISSIRLAGVTFGYEAEKPIFDQLTMDFPLGKNILICAEPGEGSSTFLKLLAVVHQPQEGQLLINGENTSQMSFEEFLPLRMRIGYTFDYGGLFSNRSLLDNLTLPLLYHNVCSLNEARTRGMELANHFGFYKKLAERPSSVTGGLRKLTSVLRTLMMDPEMLVMDDPFMGVDRHSCAKLIKILNDRRASGQIKHMYLTSREAQWPLQLACEALYLKDGLFQNPEAA